jgi:hypothetical protein
VEIDQCGATAGMAHAVHQLAEAGARFGDEVVASVPEIVEVDTCHLGRGDRGDPDPVAEDGVAEQLSFRTGEQQAVLPGQSMFGEVVLDDGNHRCGDDDDAPTGRGFRRCEERRLAIDFSELPGDAHGRRAVSTSRRRSATSSPQRSPQKQATRTKA